MKTIGFIDYCIDEWHANNYPRMIRQSRFKDAFDVALAWEECAPLGKQPLEAWCRAQHVRQATTIEEVVNTCDCLVVLSPDNAERHEALADLPLRSGKPVYIDKPIAPSLAAAQRLFAKAEAYGAPMMSSSALRFGSALESALSAVDGTRIDYCAARGGGSFQTYAIHQLEMMVMALGAGATRVMQCGNADVKHLVVDYTDGRRGSITLMPGHAFQLSARYDDDHSVTINTMDDFFPRFIDAMLVFFDTGISPIPKEQTLEIAALIEAGATALAQPDTWVPVPARNATP